MPGQPIQTTRLPSARPADARRARTESRFHSMTQPAVSTSRVMSSGRMYATTRMEPPSETPAS
eukprot:scaffold12504_cov88-Isochrysis_galbana.AAC.4